MAPAPAPAPGRGGAEGSTTPPSPDPSSSAVAGDASYVGRRVSREFGGRAYSGTVDGYDGEARLWHVAFDDGDAEELEREELLAAIESFERGERVGDVDVESDDGASFVGSRISREFGGIVYNGTVDRYDGEAKFWHVTYDDGDSEELDRAEMISAMELFKSTNAGATKAKGKDPQSKAICAPKPTAGPSSPPAPPDLPPSDEGAAGGRPDDGTPPGEAKKVPADARKAIDESSLDEAERDEDDPPLTSDDDEASKGEHANDNAPPANEAEKIGMEGHEAGKIQTEAGELDKGAIGNGDGAKEPGDGTASSRGGKRSPAGGRGERDEARPAIDETASAGERSGVETAPSPGGARTGGRPAKSDRHVPLAASVLVAAIAVAIAWLCKQVLFAHATGTHERLLRRTSLLKFQPDKFQGARRDRRYFEGWYYKLVSPVDGDGTSGAGGATSMAVVPGIFRGAAASSPESHAFLFVVLNGEGQHYYRFDVDEFSYASPREEYYVRVGPNLFTHAGVSLDLRPRRRDDASLVLRGELNFTDPSPWPVSLTHLGAMGPVGWIPGLECTHAVLSFDHVLHGSLALSRGDGGGADAPSLISFDGGRGYTEKDFGRSFPSQWVWIQSNSFRNNPGTSLFVSVARLPVFGLELPGFTAAVWHDSALIPFATWSGAKFENMRISDEEVYLAVRGGRPRGRRRGESYRAEITVDRRCVPSALLYAPVNFTRMAPLVREALRARVHLRLLDGLGNVVVDDIGYYAGLEVHGDVQWLVDNVCGKETSNKILCL